MANGRLLFLALIEDDKVDSSKQANDIPKRPLVTFSEAVAAFLETVKAKANGTPGYNASL